MDDQQFVASLKESVEVLMRLSMHSLTRFLRVAGLSMTQMNVLLHLYYRGPAEVMSFAQYMDLSPAGASQLIDRLVQQGLVSRQPSEKDRRVRMVILEAAGRRVVEESIAARQQWVHDLISTLNHEEKQSVVGALGVLATKAHALEIPRE